MTPIHDRCTEGTAAGWLCQRSFHAFVAQTRGDMLDIIHRIVLDRAVAEDLAQELFLHAWQNAALCEPARGADRLGRLRQAARVQARLARTALRRQAVEQVRAALLHADDLADDRAGNPATQRYLLAPGRLRACLGCLAPAERHALWHAFDAGLTHAEMAACMRVPLGTAKAWLRRGLGKLRTCLEEGTDRYGACGDRACSR